MSQKPCPFCEFDSKEHIVVYENNDFRVFSSNPRLMFGHTLVAPKHHVGAPFELALGLRRSFFQIVVDFQEILMVGYARHRLSSMEVGKVSDPEVDRGQVGCDISINTRPFMVGTDAEKKHLAVVGHLHAHLRPRWLYDPYYEQVLKHETSVFSKFVPDLNERERYEQLFL